MRPPPAKAAGQVALLALALALDAWATASLAQSMGSANDLFPRWLGTRAWLLQGHDPYGEPVERAIREAMGVAPGEALGAFVFGFVYPGYVALLLAPLALLPFPAAATLWLLLAQACTGLGAWLSWRAAGVEARPAAGDGAAPGGRPRRRSALPALLVGFLFPASLLNLTFGQFAAVVFAALAGAWLLLARPARPTGDALAGALLALAFVKPSLALLPASALLLWSLAGRRWYVMLGAGATGGTLLGASLLLLPGWPEAFWRSTADYARVASATTAAGVVAAIPPRITGTAQATPHPGATAILSLLAVAAVAWGWRAGPRRPGAALGAGVLLGSWLVPPLYEWNSVLLLLPILGWLRRRPRGTTALATAVLVLAGALTLPLVWRWPYESRALWPALTLAGWGAAGVARYRGTKSATLRAGSSPSSPVLT